MLALHSPHAVFSLRHAPSWLLLAAAAGAVNAIAFMACSRFVSHVTGTVSQIGIDGWSVTLALDYGLVLACFVAGAMCSAALIDGRHHQKKRPLHAVPLVAVSVTLAGLAMAGSMGLFGEFGASIESGRQLVFLSVLAFAMGLQNAAVATSTGSIVRTTHMTGPATDLGVHLGTSLFVTGEPRRIALRHAALRAGKLVAFTAGAAAGATLAVSAQYGALLIPAVIVLGATALSFITVAAPQPQEVPC